MVSIITGCVHKLKVLQKMSARCEEGEHVIEAMSPRSAVVEWSACIGTIDVQRSLAVTRTVKA